jgi:hypothetical protein
MKAQELRYDLAGHDLRKPSLTLCGIVASVYVW